MRANKLATGVAAALVASGIALAAPNGAQAEPTTDQVSSHHVTAQGEGLREFQAANGLEPTGHVDAATGRALSNATGAEVSKYFRTAADLDPTQLANARTVIGVGKGAAAISEQGQVIALMTAMQESKFVNYTSPVDHDSLGVFQQRPSTGWGTPEQLTDVAYASKLFYGVAPTSSNPGLLQIDGWETMPPGEAAQAVQVSAYPDAYAQWETFARDLLAQEGPTVDPIY